MAVEEFAVVSNVFPSCFSGEHRTLKCYYCLTVVSLRLFAKQLEVRINISLQSKTGVLNFWTGGGEKKAGKSELNLKTCSNTADVFIVSVHLCFYDLF